ncbi:MAG: ATP-binding cassette domain-containing protein [Acidimicrobiia bacterium]
MIGAITLSQGLTFLLLGLGAGSAYAIAGIGLVQIYRGSGVINFAHGGIAFLAAALYAQFSTDWAWPWVPSFLLALASAVAAGALIHLLVMKPLRKAAVLVRIIATVGVLAIIEQAIPLVLGNITQRAQTVKYFYPRGGIELIEGARLTWDRIIMVAVTIVLGAALAIIMSRTRFGLATSAVAEDEMVAEALKVDPDRVALTNWALGGGLAGLTGLLMVPWSSLVPSTFILLIVPALVAALIGRLSSFTLTVVGGLVLGSVQSLLFLWQSDPDFVLPTGYRSGWADALPFIVMIVLLASRGSVFPRRGESTSALPAVGRARLRPLPALGWAVALGAVALTTSPGLADAISTTAGVAVVGLSIVVVTGLAGQISLAQLAVAGMGALVAGRLSGELGWPFPLGVVAGIVAGSVAGFVFALPALRTRGPTLAVATIGLGVAIETTVFTNQGISGASFSGIPIERPTLFGWDINAIEHASRFAAVAVVLMIAMMLVVSNLRAGSVGRRMLAVRSNERAAAALGVSVQRIKLVAFVISAGIVSVGGILLSFQFDNVNLRGTFGFTDSLLAVVFTLIGGIGFILGPLIGAAISPSGIVAFLFNDLDTIERWLIIIAGLIVIGQLIAAPDGVVKDVVKRFGRKRHRLEYTIGNREDHVAHEPAALEVSNLDVAYGPVIAVTELNLVVRPGEIVGLIGPNGAGKTSAIDAISGFTAARGGRVVLGDQALDPLTPHRRARLGLARTFQTVEPFDDLTVAENLAVASEDLGAGAWLTACVRIPALELTPATGIVIESFGLQGELDAFPPQLSQGGRRLLGVARAMATAPSVLLLDEPAAGLDEHETRRLAGLLRRVANEWNVGMLLVEHDISMVTAICDHVVALDFGETIFSGSAEQALADENVRLAYLGEELPASVDTT